MDKCRRKVHEKYDFKFKVNYDEIFIIQILFYPQLTRYTYSSTQQSLSSFLCVLLLLLHKRFFCIIDDLQVCSTY